MKTMLTQISHHVIRLLDVGEGKMMTMGPLLLDRNCALQITTGCTKNRCHPV